MCEGILFIQVLDCPGKILDLVIISTGGLHNFSYFSAKHQYLIFSNSIMKNSEQGPNLLEKARSFQQSGDLNNAEIHYKQAIENLDVAVEAHSELAMLYIGYKGDPQRAVQHWQKALELDSDHFESLANMGYMLSQMQDFQNALKYLKRANSIDPRRDDVVMQIAQLSAQMGNIDEAENYLSRLIKDRTDNENVYLLLAQVRALKNDIIGSESCLHELLKIKPKLPEALINLAQLAESSGDTEKAASYYDEAITSVPYHFLANMEYGRFLSNLGKLDEGLTFLKKAAQLKPGEWTIHVHLGNIYQELGEFDKAITAFKKALSINPNDLGTRQNLSRVLTRFVPPWHLKMLADHERNDAFEEAIKRAVKPDTIALDIGTGSGILSMMAVRHGAQKVFACEQSKYIAAAAKENITKNGMRSQIKLFESKSTQLTAEKMGEKPSLVVAEIFDSGLLGEHAVPSFRHALSQLCTPGARVIPQSAAVKGRLINAEKIASVHPMKNISGFDVSAFDQFRVAEEYITQNLSEVSHEFCSDEFDLMSVDFMNLWPAMDMNQYKIIPLEVPVTNDKPVHGIAFWFNLNLDDQTSLSSAPGRKDNHWGQALSFFPAPLAARSGDTLKIDLYHNDIKIWFGQPQVLSQ